MTLRFNCSEACRIFPDQGLNLCLLHWQADSYPLYHQGSPRQGCFCSKLCKLSLEGKFIRLPVSLFSRGFDEISSVLGGKEGDRGDPAGNWENRASRRVVPTHSLSDSGKSQHPSLKMFSIIKYEHNSNTVSMTQTWAEHSMPCCIGKSCVLVTCGCVTS